MNAVLPGTFVTSSVVVSSFRMKEALYGAK
jgi:hypothetical protein